MNEIHIQYYKTMVGEVIIGSFDDKLCLLDWRYRKMRTTVDNRIQKSLNAKYVEKSDAVIKTTILQLEEYFKGERKQFDIPLLFNGTAFQKEVWNSLLCIPYGSTASYAELAKNINNEKAVRAVASANGANAISIIVPCHRVIGSNGELTGYAGGLPVKKRLLKLEKAI